jgi:hypothetical protein
MIRKSVRYIVYDNTDTYIGEWNDVASDISIQTEINNPNASINVNLPRNELFREIVTETVLDENDLPVLDENDLPILSDDFAGGGVGLGSTLDLNYRVDIYTFYGTFETLLDENGEEIIDENDLPILTPDGYPEGILLFRGKVIEWTIDFGGANDTKILLLSYGHQLSNHVLKSGSDTTVTYTSQDPSVIAQSVIDYAQTLGLEINYSAESIEMTGTTVTYTFNLNTIKECLDKILELCPSGWYWTYDPGSSLYSLKARSVSKDRFFTLKKDVMDGSITRSMLGMANTAYFTGGGDPALLRMSEDAASVTSWDNWLAKLSDQRVTDNATADIFAESHIDRLKNPLYASTLTINNEHYDPIEDISLGELVGLSNFGDVLDDIEMQIVGMSYSLDMVQLTLDKLIPSVTKRVEDIKRNLDVLQQVNNPVAPS